jgi:CheY-like chemotaxis protein
VQDRDTAPAHLRLPDERSGLWPQQAAALGPSPADDQRLILLAEDDEDIVELVSFRLERSGYRVARAHDGEEAVRLAHELRPLLAIFDVSMPNMTGIEATRSLRDDPSTAALPIILLTAHAAGSDLAAGMEAGATAYVTKPFSPQELSSRVASVLGDV